MKRFSFLFVLVLLLIVPLFAGETTEENTMHLNYSSATAISNYGISWDKGKMEYGVTVRSGFPNLFSIFVLDGLQLGIYEPETEDFRPYRWDDAFQDLMNSVNLAYVVEGTVRKDFSKKERHDLDLGVGLAVGFSPVVDEFLCGALVDANFRYTHNFRSGNGFTIGLEYPLCAVLLDFASDGEWGPLFIPGYPAMAVLWNVYCGCTIGYRWVL